MCRAGRGVGKTRTGAEFVRGRVDAGFKRIALVAKTPGDARDVMIEGEAGILSTSPPWNRPKYEPSKRRLTWPNGAIATTYSGADPDQLRGPTHDTFWVDELAAFKYPRDTWDNLQLTMRHGDDPKGIVTTTPKPLALLKEIEASPYTVCSPVESSYANQINLTPAFFKQIISKYEGTRTGRQEIYAQLLDQAEFALWQREWIDGNRYELFDHTLCRRIVVSIDPAGSAEKESNETGILVVGIQDPDHWYVLADYSGRYSPHDWATQAIRAMEDWGADSIVAEKNQGGDMIEANLRSVMATVPYKSVWASVGKAVRAEPIANLYQQGRVHHVGVFTELEDQLCSWEPVSGHKSPDRLDALVHGVAELQHDAVGIWV